MSADADLLAIWLRGWALTRGVAAPVWDDGGWRVEVEDDDQIRRFVFSDVSDAVARRAAAVHEPKIFIKVCAPAEAVAALLPHGWDARQTGAFMTLEGRMTRAAADDDRFAVEITRAGSAVFCSVRDRHGLEAGRGRAVLVEDQVIYDRIAVEPGFRPWGSDRHPGGAGALSHPRLAGLLTLYDGGDPRLRSGRLMAAARPGCRVCRRGWPG